MINKVAVEIGSALGWLVCVAGEIAVACTSVLGDICCDNRTTRQGTGAHGQKYNRHSTHYVHTICAIIYKYSYYTLSSTARPIAKRGGETSGSRWTHTAKKRTRNAAAKCVCGKRRHAAREVERETDQGVQEGRAAS